MNFCVFENNETNKMIKLNRVTLKQAETAVSNIHRKAPVLESLFNKVTYLKSATVLKSDFNTGAFL